MLEFGEVEEFGVQAGHQRAQPVAQRHAENLLIFTDRREGPTQSLWYWVKRSRDESGKPRLVPRRHEYFRGQPIDLFASKLQAMVVELSELDETGRPLWWPHPVPKDQQELPLKTA